MKRIITAVCLSLLMAFSPLTAFAGGGEIFIDISYVVSGEASDSNAKFLAEDLIPLHEPNYEYGIATINGQYNFSGPDGKHGDLGGATAMIKDGAYTGEITAYMFDWVPGTYTLTSFVLPKGYEFVSGGFTIKDSDTESTRIKCTIEVRKLDAGAIDSTKHVILSYIVVDPATDTHEALAYAEPVTGDFVLQKLDGSAQPTGETVTISKNNYTTYPKFNNPGDPLNGLYIWIADCTPAELPTGSYKVASCQIPDGYVRDTETGQGSVIYVSDADAYNNEQKYWYDIYVRKTAATVQTPTESGTSAQPSAEQGLVASPTSSDVFIDGKQVAFEAYNINGNNYFKLRDVAFALMDSAKGFDVVWNSEMNSIGLITQAKYTVAGGELESSGAAGNKTPVPTGSKILLNGQFIDVAAYNINGYNYFKLRDIGKAIDFNVAWDGANNAISVITAEGYTE